MGAAQSRVRGIQRLHAAELRSKTIATERKCSYTTIAEALHSTDSKSPPVKRRRKKIIVPEISRCIETLSLMDSPLTNNQIKTKIQERRPDLEVSRNTIRDAWVNLGFKFRPPMIKQNLSPGQRFQCHQFGLDMLTKNLDPVAIVFSDEC
jgi:hypothetical protein